MYYHNFANSLWVLRKKAMTQYKWDEQQVFVKCLNLFSNAFRLAPSNFPYASDFAQAFYAIKPFPALSALNAWTNALAIAPDGLEREGVFVHLARVKMLAGKYSEARQDLQTVKDAKYDRLKRTCSRASKSGNIPKPQPMLLRQFRLQPNLSYLALLGTNTAQTGDPSAVGSPTG